MKKFTLSILAIFMAAFVWTACIDDAVSPGVEALRNATAAYMNAKAALETANAAYRTAQAAAIDALTAKQLIANKKDEDNLKVTIAQNATAIKDAEAALEVAKKILAENVETLRVWLAERDLKQASLYLESYSDVSDLLADLFLDKAQIVADIAHAQLLIDANTGNSYDLLTEFAQRQLDGSKAELAFKQATLTSLQAVAASPAAATAELNQLLKDRLAADNRLEQIDAEYDRLDIAWYAADEALNQGYDVVNEYRNAQANSQNEVTNIAVYTQNIVEAEAQLKPEAIATAGVVTTAKNALVVAQANLAQLPTELTIAQSQLVVLQKALTDATTTATATANANLVTANTAVTNAQTAYTNTLATQTTAAQGELNTANTNLTASQATLATAQATLATNQTALTNANAALTNANTILSGANTTKTAKKTILDAAVASLATTQTTLNAAIATRTAAQNVLDVATTDDNTGSTPATQAAKSAAQTAFNTADAAVTTATTARDAAQVIKDDAQGVFNDASTDVTNAQATVTTAQTNANTAQTNVNSANATIVTANADITIKTAAVTTATANNTPAAILLRPLVVAAANTVTAAQADVTLKTTLTGTTAITAGVTTQANAVTAKQAEITYLSAASTITGLKQAVVDATEGVAQATANETAARTSNLNNAKDNLESAQVSKAEYDADIAALQTQFNATNIVALEAAFNTVDDKYRALDSEYDLIYAVYYDRNDLINTLENYVGGNPLYNNINSEIEDTKDDIESIKEDVDYYTEQLADSKIDKQEAIDMIEELKQDMKKIDDSISANQKLATKWLALVTSLLG